MIVSQPQHVTWGEKKSASSTSCLSKLLLVNSVWTPNHSKSIDHFFSKMQTSRKERESLPCSAFHSLSFYVVGPSNILWKEALGVKASIQEPRPKSDVCTPPPPLSEILCCCWVSHSIGLELTFGVGVGMGGGSLWKSK